VNALRTTCDATAAMKQLASHATAILARVAPVYEILRRAAADPELGALLAENRRARRADQRRLTELLADAGHLRPGLRAGEAADILYGLVNEDVFTMLTTDCGWSRRRFERWLATLLQRELTGASPLG
jgi:hypothetical protein